MIKHYKQSLYIFVSILANRRIVVLRKCCRNTHTHTHIYVYRHPQKGCFVVSQLFSVVRYMRFFKQGSKPG